MIFGYIFINHILPFAASNFSAAFFLCRPMVKHNSSSHNFLNKNQDDISSALAINSYTGCPKKHGNSVTNSISSFQIIL